MQLAFLLYFFLTLLVIIDAYCYTGYGPGCIKHLKVHGSFLQPFSAFQRIFSDAIMDHSAEGSLLRIGNTENVRKSLPKEGTVAEIKQLPPV